MSDIGGDCCRWEGELTQWDNNQSGGTAMVSESAKSHKRGVSRIFADGVSLIVFGYNFRGIPSGKGRSATHSGSCNEIRDRRFNVTGASLSELFFDLRELNL